MNTELDDISTETLCCLLLDIDKLIKKDYCRNPDKEEILNALEAAVSYIKNINTFNIGELVEYKQKTRQLGFFKVIHTLKLNGISYCIVQHVDLNFLQIILTEDLCVKKV